MSTFTYNGHTYMLTDLPVNWQQAEDQAVSLGGHLVTINDTAEQSALLTWLTTDYSTESSFWTGYTDQTTEGSFQWISGEIPAIPFANWDVGEPNNAGAGENYTQIFNFGLWNDLSGVQLIRGIIEILDSVNNAPTLTTFSAPVSTGNEDSPITVSFADLQAQGNEADVDGTVNAFVVKAVSSGSLKIGSDAATASAWSASNNTVDATHQAYWTPAANANGTLDAFTVVAKDNGGLESATPVQAKVAVAAVPDVTVTAGATPVEGGTTGTFLFTLDSPAPAGGLTVNFGLGGVATLATDYTVTAGSNVTTVTGSSSFTIAAGASSAVLNINAVDDHIPDPNETVILTLTTGSGYQLGLGNVAVTLTITDAPLTNTTPVANPDTVSATEDTPRTYLATSLLGNDTDAEGNLLSLASVSSGANGTAVLSADGQSVLFTPNQNFNGVAYFGYQATDGTLNSNTAMVTVNVAAVNDAPVANPDVLNATEDSPIMTAYFSSYLLANDTDAEGNPLTIASVSSGANGTVALSADHKMFTFTPNENFNGMANFTYQASDGLLNSNSATVSVIVASVNDAPEGTDKTVTINQGSAYTVTVADFGFSDPKDSPANAFLNVIVSSLPATTDGVYKFDGGDVAVGQSMSVTDINAGKLIFTPTTDKNGTGLGGLGFTVQDNGGTANGGVDTDTTANTLSFNITAVNSNQAPILNTPAEINYTDTKFDDSFATVTGVLVASDVDGDSLTYGIVGGTTGSIPDTVVASNTYGDLTVYTATGAYHFVPNDVGIEALTADKTASFTVTVFDGQLSDSQTLTINIAQKGVTESNGDDVLIGTFRNDKFDGLAGNDIIVGFAGDDIINGGAGADIMIGGKGNDTYYVDNVGDVVKEYSGEDDRHHDKDDDHHHGKDDDRHHGKDDDRHHGKDDDRHHDKDDDHHHDKDDDHHRGKDDDHHYGKDDDHHHGKGDDHHDAGGVDTVHTGISYQLTANVENLVLTGTAANGTGNELDNHLTGNSANNILSAGDGNDILTGGNGADTLIGGHGQDTYNLAETTAATDTLRIAKGDSLINSYDKAFNFALGTGTINTTGVDKLDLDSSHIAANTAGVNGVNAGLIHSHSVSDGIISFDDVNHYSQPLAITDTNLANVFSYLQTNITGNKTVAFVSEGNTFVFQDGGTQDTLVELVGVTATSLSTTGITDHSLWIV